MVEWRKTNLTDERELGGVVGLMQRFYAEELHLPMTEEQALGTLRELGRSPSTGTLYVALASGLAGYALVMRYLSNECGGYVGYLDEFYLLPEARGQGGGGQFLAGLRLVAQGQGLVGLWLETEPGCRAHRLYARAGFQRSNRVLLREAFAGEPKPLPDVIDFGLKALFTGYNPGLRSAAVGHHFAGRSNRFWGLLFQAGLTPYRLRPEEDRSVLAQGYGLTNLARRPTRAAAELGAEELAQGALELRRMVEAVRPRALACVGKDVYRRYAGTSKPVEWGRQEVPVVPGVIDFVLPNPSGLNRMPLAEQVAWYRQLAEALRQPPSH